MPRDPRSGLIWGGPFHAEHGRYTQLMTTTLIAGLNLAWLIPITCKHGWCRNPWFCISIDSSEQLVQVAPCTASVQTVL